MYEVSITWWNDAELDSLAEVEYHWTQFTALLRDSLTIEEIKRLSSGFDMFFNVG